jgi:hypothetical protein
VVAALEDLRKAPKDQPADGDDVQRRYLDAATQYYAAGRFAVVNGLVPAAGNLFHHAIELYLRGSLWQQTNGRKRRKLGHPLGRAWRRFKQELGDSALDEFDGVIGELERFDDLRRPETILRLGTEVSFSFAISAPTPAAPVGRPVPKYVLVVDEIDRLVAVILRRTGVNPRALAKPLGRAGKEYLVRDNVTGIWLP